MPSLRILGVDPGSRRTGYGCVDVVDRRIQVVAHGTLKLSSISGKSEIPLEQRLLDLHQGLAKIISELKPDVLAVERVFFAKNAVSALKLGQARGVVILAGAINGLCIAEYSPNEIKAAVVGHGKAGKEQVAGMVKILTGCGAFSTNDASDAVAIAICHAQKTSGLKSPAASGSRKAPRSLAEAIGITPEMAEGRRRLRLER